MYSIVRFVNDNSIEGVPTSWILNVQNQDYCKWPPKLPSFGITRLVKRGTPPKANWNLNRCMIKYRDLTFVDMRSRLEASAYLATDSEMNTTGNPHNQTNFSSDNSSDGLKYLENSCKKIKSFQGGNFNDIQTMCEQQLEISGMTIGSQNSPSNLTFEQKVDQILYLVTDLEYTQNAINSKLDIINQENSQIKEEIGALTTIMRRQSGIGGVPTIESNLPQLPVNTEEEMQTLEECLKEEGEINNLIYKLSNFEGSHMRGTINKIMRNVIGNELANKYSMQGNRGKLSFMKLTLCTCIQGQSLIAFFLIILFYITITNK